MFSDQATAHAQETTQSSNNTQAFGLGENNHINQATEKAEADPITTPPHSQDLPTGRSLDLFPEAGHDPHLSEA